VASLPKLLLQCCQFAALPGAAQDSIVGGCDTPNLVILRQAWFRYLLCRNESTDFFCPIKRFLEIYANECNQRNRTEAAAGFVQHGVCVRWADVQTWSFVLQINFSDKLKLCAPKPARTQSPKPLYAILNDTVYYDKLH
jgi:hypothetical protein